ncbi:putative DNA repair protein Rad26 [Aspergillus alliaceus]|uniref:putative DNA repair protein Rad26 n=1 Tax=Petromyces alliaceus TaxID=209559 RepID=UPI0012A3D711|nr:uncharacterized protein BDW43DRAFT_290382 [Aspergillus alliaceus]KAB8228752.1 hypothetical protein BDW43DRAFT_290382 [Aspergillus alliaceus]
MEENDDEIFSDDGFDNLPPGTLFQLEQNAVLANQTRSSAQPQHQPQPSRALASHNPQTRASERSFLSNPSLNPPAHLHTGLTNDYGALDVGELDAVVLQDEVEPIYGLGQPAGFIKQPGSDGHIGEAYPEPMEVEGETSYLSGDQTAYDVISEKLAVENERYRQMTEELAAAKSIAETKAGEIAIIRSNQAKLAENYERQVAALRKAMAEEVARHKEEVEAARAEGKMLATENAFLKQDLAEETMRINNLKVKGRAEEKTPGTPKKHKALPFRDGFDDDEILAVSPSKSTRFKRMTPTVGGKRKRKLSDDSAIPLQLGPQPELGPMSVEVPVGDMSGDASDEVVPNRPAQIDKQTSQFIKRLLNHRTFPNEQSDLEVMARLAFPSEPQQTLSAILLEETASLDFGNYLLEYARAIISLWSRALHEKFFEPIPMFMGILRHTLALDAPSSAPELIESLVPVLQESAEINGIPRFKHSPVSRQNFGQVKQTPLSELQLLVDSTEALGLLYQMACSFLHVDRVLEKFWRYVRYDFVLMMLNCSQAISDIILTLNLLSTSIRIESFGSLQDTEQDQVANENYIVDRVANLLSEIPQVDEGQPPHMPSEICEMRLEALSLLMSVAFNQAAPASTHGSMVIATHSTVLARLIRAMHDELDALYASPPEKELHASLVNGLMRLIYGVMRRHPEQADLQSKLCRVAGGKQKFLVVLTRLAFSEGLILEAGIEDETVEMAHEILDDAVNPQEAEALLEAFSSSKQQE